MITLKQAKNLKHGDILLSVLRTNANGTPQQWRVNGKVKRWKRDPGRIKVPVKHGLYDYDYLTNDTLKCVYLP